MVKSEIELYHASLSASKWLSKSEDQTAGIIASYEDTSLRYSYTIIGSPDSHTFSVERR